MIKTWPKFPLKLQNIAVFLTLNFSRFRRLRRRKFGVLFPKNLEFYVQKPPPLGRPPPQRYTLNYILITQILIILKGTSKSEYKMTGDLENWRHISIYKMIRVVRHRKRFWYPMSYRRLENLFLSLSILDCYTC